ncbi:alpha-amylase family glycosyl hydrolase [Pseudoflavitalea rhizosphaerae]|uniref:alpha-amylase family glycosyl hydrolase n=1 Tax=Pseudoflavitalea rhizosphaerae TaxID=1884793 RepID=UPI000F8E9AC4|nr:alpha-amylase family glycosyl hydrolase [Pseudoflavitalea rhizosphaerae]
MARKFPAVPWMQSATVYEVNLRQYTPEGSFNAFASHLPRLADMGVQVLWFMPITPISLAGRKGTLGSYYACSDYLSVNPEFGTLDDFRLLVRQAHELGMKVIIDWVANHTGLDHVWTRTHPQFYKRNGAGEFYDTHGWDDVIDLNYYDQPMRRMMIEAMKFWIDECDIDGFRCDMAHLVLRDFWQQARTALDPVKPLFWLAETEDLHYLDVFDCCYAWRWMHATEKYFRRETDLRSLVQLLSTYENEFPEGTLPLFFTANHDENSWNGTEFEKYGDAARLLAVFSFTWHGMPLIYSGQELPNQKRLKFFDKDEIEWTDDVELHSFYKSLIRLHATHPAILAGSAACPQWLATDRNDAVLAYTRIHQNRELLVVLNCSSSSQVIHFSSPAVNGVYMDAIAGKTIELHSSAIELPPYGYFAGTR